ncbi:unnamed protein product [Adineta steineri]|uniref:Uncharacterized protein n=1 Tax=Adineta steineri TaxID=433720 RepID=A0A818HW45_9BILA|nr:unnamed protein product [Adineta steineri]
MYRLLTGILILHHIQIASSIICYQCTDCPDPFTETYPYVTLANNTNFLSQCTKTVMNMADGRRLVSKGTVFFCPTQTSAADAQIYCCSSDYCNVSTQLNVSMSLLYLSFFILMKIYL